MGIGCVLLLWSVAAAIALFVAVIGGFVLVSGIRRRRRARTIIGALVAGVGGVTGLVSVAFVMSWLVFGNMSYSSTSTRVFRDEFGFAASPDVTGFQSEASGSTDSAVRFLRFNASLRTIQSIADKGFKRAPLPDCRTWTERRPKWWRPVITPTSRCYIATRFDDSFASHEAWLFYDEASRVAHYYYVGVD
ncbi:MAG TPA: hypothetical protein VJZ00_06825 [Thermoanaerobaculia bacterium]|nr:hypothetical protein [Thermoanaerobaculia bacterium]